MNFRLNRIWAACIAILSISACTKIETTELGGGLIPAVDNVKTFETVLDVIGNNYLDTMPFRVNGSNPHMVGGISNDPVFGTSTASMYFQMSPTTYPYRFAKDSLVGTGLGLDSAVLILEYQGYYGDSAAPVTFNLYQTDQVLQPDLSLTPFYDMNNTLTANKGVKWGTKTMRANQFKDSVIVAGDDSAKVVNQLRIPIDQSLALSLITADTLQFANDTLYRNILKGFALEAEGTPNTLMYFLMGGQSKLQFYYKAKIAGGKVDTTTSAFTFTSRSGHAVKFQNDHTGSELSNHLVPDPIKGDNNLYIQASPGTYSILRIPGLDTFKNVNRVIHRAELRIVQDAPLADPEINAPAALYLDVVDTTKKLFRGVPYDLSPLGFYYCYPSAGVSFSAFGGATIKEKVGNDSLAVYRFNISRYLQNVVSKGEKLFPQFRLSAPFYMFYEECANGAGVYPQQIFPYTSGGQLLNPPGRGRIKLAGGNPSVPAIKRMQMRIIYSTL